MRWLGISLPLLFPLYNSAQLLKDGSFELPRTTIGSNGGWTVCAGDPDTQVLDGNGPGIFGISTAPANGHYYLGMVATELGLQEAIGQPLAVQSGMHYYGSISIFRATGHQNWNGTGQVQLWGGVDCNSAAEMLWSSGTISNENAWESYPIAFNAIANHTWISVVLAFDAGSGDMTYVCMDDLRLYNAFFAVDFLGLEATPIAESMQVGWETVALTDNVRFDVEWSIDGRSFQPVGIVEGLAGARAFAFNHVPATVGRQYYRIKTIDRGGHEHLSEVREAVWGGSTSTIFPNPAAEHVSVSLGNAEESILGLRLLDLSGRLLFEESGNGAGAMDLQLPDNLAEGCYWLQVQTKSRMLTHRLMIGN